MKKINEEIQIRKEQENCKIMEFFDICKNLSKEFEIPPLFIAIDEEIEADKYQNTTSAELEEEMSAIISELDTQK